MREKPSVVLDFVISDRIACEKQGCAIVPIVSFCEILDCVVFLSLNVGPLIYSWSEPGYVF